MQDQPSPLGRYAAGHEAGERVRVRLLGTPLGLLVAAREHHDAVLRELALVAVTSSAVRLPPRLVELVEVFGQTYARPARRPDAAVDAAVARGEQVIDLTYDVPVGVAEAAVQLEGHMRELDAFCADGLLITLPRSAPVRAFAEWYLEQFCEQLAGRPPRAWSS